MKSQTTGSTIVTSGKEEIEYQSKGVSADKLLEIFRKRWDAERNVNIDAGPSESQQERVVVVSGWMQSIAEMARWLAEYMKN